jgi:hypothetical protein
MKFFLVKFSGTLAGVGRVIAASSREKFDADQKDRAARFHHWTLIQSVQEITREEYATWLRAQGIVPDPSKSGRFVDVRKEVSR